MTGAGIEVGSSSAREKPPKIARSSDKAAQIKKGASRPRFFIDAKLTPNEVKNNGIENHYQQTKSLNGDYRAQVLAGFL
jgi:hypothetical protein